MGTPGGFYGHVQWNNGGDTFGGHNLFWYDGKLHVGMTNDVGVQYVIQSGDSMYTANDLFLGRNITVVSKIRRTTAVAGTIYPIWVYGATGSVLTDYTNAGFRTAGNIYAKADVYTRAEMDTRYQRSALMSSYYTKTQTLPRSSVYTRADVYTKAEFLALLAGYIARNVALDTLASYASATHRHVIDLDPNDTHDHNGDTTSQSGHDHVVVVGTPANV